MVKLTKKKKLTKKQMHRLKLWWDLLKLIDAEYWERVMLIEKRMRQDPVVGIKDVEFFWSDGWAGIGNNSLTLDLIQREDLEK